MTSWLVNVRALSISLHHPNTRMKDILMNALKNMQQLEVLALSSWKPADVIEAVGAAPPTLRELQLGGFQAYRRLPGVRTITQHCPELERDLALLEVHFDSLSTTQKLGKDKLLTLSSTSSANAPPHSPPSNYASPESPRIPELGHPVRLPKWSLGFCTFRPASTASLIEASAQRPCPRSVSGRPTPALVPRRPTRLI
jgi:hypothetical protein